MGKLSVRAVAAAKAGRHGDGRGLWLAVAPSGAKKWVHRFTFAGRIREMGLGDARVVPLHDAREKAQDNRLLIARGINPIEARRAATVAATAPKPPTFGEVADRLFAAKSPSWSAGHAQQWHHSIVRHAASIRDTPVNEVGLQAVLAIVQPIWFTIPETARRVLTRLEEILDFAEAHAWRSGSNPARQKGNLSHILRHPKIERAHFAAMDYRQIPEFLTGLRKDETPARLALEFLILTAGRSSECREATFSEIDFKDRIWAIDASRMKSRRPHRVPLSARAMAIIEIMRARSKAGSKFIFPSAKLGRPIFYGPLYRLLPPGMTLHGFRSSFRDWAGEETSYPREVAEQALAHATGSAVEQAYRRGDALEKRRALMEAWAQYCEPGASCNVIPMTRAAN